jgi:hypothetical protein
VRIPLVGHGEAVHPLSMSEWATVLVRGVVSISMASKNILAFVPDDTSMLTLKSQED